eukprot:CAMPEP_0117742704 /NCGR_PEP_ID=MMETSP0947-20121206/5697_1 /TAXON_ID=44440 /ORGANISM="Chattonella subsalsa, Strain CCMP2191" /LENGTH=134 /DNA_ID=CAMNT_0005559263 /DNA_START=562 /DNA_END=963 /DNA_ORIENTATION=-
MRILHFFGGRFFKPFSSIIDDHLIIGSMPFASDVKYMAEELKVVAVVNMCAEYAGPVKEYQKYGIEQLQLATFDTTSPTYNHLEIGIAFISKCVADHKDHKGRVFIHCKGGVGRATTMALAYLISKGTEPQAGW